MGLLTDMFDTNIVVGDVVAFGKSNRNDPINVGIVHGFDSTKEEIIILARGGHKPSRIPMFHSKRMIVLPRSYKGYLELDNA